MVLDLNFFLRELAARSRDAIIITSAEIDEPAPKIVYCNSAFEDMTGYSPQEAMGHSPRSLLGVDDTDRSERDKIRQAMKAWLAGDETVYERVTLKNRKKNGDIFWVELILVPLWARDYTTSYWCAIQRDVTEQVVQKHQIESLTSRLAAIHHAAPDGIMVVDDQRIIQDVNPAAECLFGWQRSDLVGQSVDVLLGGLSDDSAATPVDPFCLNALDGTNRQSEFILQALRKDGSSIDISLSRSACQLGEGRATIAILRDISELQRKNAELIELSSALSERNAQAELAIKAKSEFLASVSHELRTPLNAIIGFSDFINSIAEQEHLSSRVREYLRDIHSSGHHLLSLVDDILHASDLENSTQKITAEHIELRAIMADVCNMLEPMASAKNLPLEAEFGASLEVCSDPRLIKQILINFVTNAIKFTDRGGVMLFAEERADSIAVSVQDSGAGIAAADQSRIFGKFSRLTEHAYTADAEGMGLGLNIAERLAKSLGGRIKVDSTEGHGSTFTLVLPHGKSLAAE